MASHEGESKDSRYDRDSINTVPKQDPTKPINMEHLSRFVVPETVGETFQRTADYARDPRTYLEANLGNKVLSERGKLLSIPEKPERDYYGTGEHKQHFEQHIAALFGKPHGLFFLTGVQAQLTALKVHCTNAGTNKVAWHITSHLEGAEESAYKELYGLERILLGSDPDTLPTVSEIEAVLSLPAASRPAVLLLELPNRELGCQTYTYPDLAAIAASSRANGVKLHLDGARIWEIEPFYRTHFGKTFADFGMLFDTIYVSFYKGLRGCTGAMLLGPDAEFVAQAKKWQRRAGGNAFQLSYEVVDCERGFNENVGTFGAKWAKMDEVVEGIRAATGGFRNGVGEEIVEFWPPKAVCCQIRTAFRGFSGEELSAARDRVGEKLGVWVFERVFKDPRRWREEVVDELSEAGKERDKEVQAEVPKTAEPESSEQRDEKRHMLEWMIVPDTLKLDTKVFVDAYVQLCEGLLAARKS